MPAILLTRPADGSARFAKALRARLGDVPVVVSPVLKIVPTGAQPDVSDNPVVLFSSRNGVVHCGISPAPGQVALCVGDATAQAARAAGFQAVSAQGNVHDLARLIVDRANGRPLLHIRGRHSAGDLAVDLAKQGLTLRETVVYDQETQPLSDTAQALLAGSQPVIAPLFSPRSAASLAAQGPWHAPLYLAAISEAVAGVAPEPHIALRVAQAPDQAAMLDLTCALFKAAQLLEGGSRAQ